MEVVGQNVDKWSAPPQRQCLGKSVGFRGRVYTRGRVGLTHPGLKSCDIYRITGQVRSVCATDRHDEWRSARFGQRCPRPRQTDVQSAAWILGLLGTPDRLDELRGRDEPAGLDEQSREQGPALR
jgi:hypothetical protein